MEKPANIMFFTMTILGTIISISANTWFLAWFGLEMNLVGFIPLLIFHNNINSPEAAMKYFLIQGVASSLLIISTLQISINFHNSSLALLALMTKLGAAPCHFWVPNLVESINWSNVGLLLTWQKIGPLFLTTLTGKELLMPFILASLAMGTLMGFNQSSTKKILAFSSISHLAWVLTAVKLNLSILTLYFTIYAATIVALVAVVNSNNINSINKTLTANKVTKTSLYLLLLSLGGLPPFLGFFPKMLVIMAMMNPLLILLPMLLIASSVINLYFYLRLTYSMMAVYPTTPPTHSQSYPKLVPFIILLGPMMPLFI